MTPTANDKETRMQRGRTFIPSLALVVGIAVSTVLFFVIKANIESEGKLRFERQASDAQHVIAARIHSYADVMYGLSALYSASYPVSRAEFNHYVTGLDLERRYPGFWTFNYAEYVPHEAKAKFLARVRKDTTLDARGYPKFEVKPAGDRSEYYVLTYVEPMAGNESVFGLDISANPAAANPRAIAEALARARDSGKLTSSGQLLQVTKGQERLTSLAVRLPVYRSGMPVGSVEQRRAAYLGSVGAAFFVKKLMRDVLDEQALEFMRFKLYEAGPVQQYVAGRAVAADRLLFDSKELSKTPNAAPVPDGEDSSFKAVLPIETAGRVWEAHFSTPIKTVVGGVGAALPWLVFAGGFLSSLLLFAVFYSMASSRSRAVEMANVITKDLRESEASLAQAQHIAQLGSWSLEPVSRAMTWSEETYRILGLQPSETSPHYDELVGRVHERDRTALQEALQGASETGREREIDHRISPGEGETRWVHTIVQPGQHDQKTLLHGTIRDITEGKLAALRLQVAHGVAQLIAGATDPDQVMPRIIETVCAGLNWECGAYWGLDKEGALLRCTASWGGNAPTIQEFLALTKKLSAPSGVDLPGHAWAKGGPLFVEDIASEQSFSRAQAALQAGLHGALALPITSGGTTFGVIELFSDQAIRSDEELIHLLDSLSAQIGQSFQRKLAEDQLRFIATHDSLTDLPNRSMFNEGLRHALHQGSRYNRGIAVMFIDIDRFKVVNDTLGHSAGDRLLQDCARRLTECLRESDTVARLGGDEFVVMVENFTAPKDAIAIAQKILTGLARPFFVDGQEFLMSASIGISTFPDDGKDTETLLKNADIAMYRAKDQGRNNYQFYSAHMNKHTFERLAMESSLRRAVERNEFLLHYQPKLDLRTGAIAGVEALVRWQHPDWGMVSPAQFIPLAEESGLIVQIGEWVLKTACEQNKRWRDEGIAPLRVAVNLSARQFMQKTLLGDVARIIAQSGLTPDCLELEITESLVMTNPEHATETLHKLKAMGISLSIDDFGTGYSSLAYLKRFPIDCVKIDRSFIKDIPIEADDMAITKGIIALGHSLRLKIIAEGVETKEQQDFLRSNGCDEMQGFLFSKPLPAEQITALLKNHSRKANLNVVEPRKRA